MYKQTITLICECTALCVCVCVCVYQMCVYKGMMNEHTATGELHTIISKRYSPLDVYQVITWIAVQPTFKF